MTVKELIDRLKECNPKAQVMYSIKDGNDETFDYIRKIDDSYDYTVYLEA